MPNLFDIVSTFLLDENFLLLFDIANFNFDTFLLFYYCLGIMLIPKYCVGIVWPPKKVIPRISGYDTEYQKPLVLVATESKSIITVHFGNSLKYLHILNSTIFGTIKIVPL